MKNFYWSKIYEVRYLETWVPSFRTSGRCRRCFVKKFDKVNRGGYIFLLGIACRFSKVLLSWRGLERVMIGVTGFFFSPRWHSKFLQSVSLAVVLCLVGLPYLFSLPPRSFNQDKTYILNSNCFKNPNLIFTESGNLIGLWLICSFIWIYRFAERSVLFSGLQNTAAKRGY